MAWFVSRRNCPSFLTANTVAGPFLRRFRWGHVRQLDRVSRELLARARSAGAGWRDVDRGATCATVLSKDVIGPLLHQRTPALEVVSPPVGPLAGRPFHMCQRVLGYLSWCV